jgi:hypothetical protein
MWYVIHMFCIYIYRMLLCSCLTSKQVITVWPYPFVYSRFWQVVGKFPWAVSALWLDWSGASLVGPWGGIFLIAGSRCPATATVPATISLVTHRRLGPPTSVSLLPSLLLALANIALVFKVSWVGVCGEPEGPRQTKGIFKSSRGLQIQGWWRSLTWSQET